MGEKKRQFIFIEVEDGGASGRRIDSVVDLRGLYGWMHDDCAVEDRKLLDFLEKAEIGDRVEHRLGWMFCVKEG